VAEADPLELDPEEMRRLGYRAVDLMVERIASLGDGPAWRGASRAEMEERLREPPPEEPMDPDLLFATLAEDVLPFAGHHDHPRFFGFVPSCPTWPGVLGDLIAAGTNVFAGTWLQSAGASTAELVVIDWFRQWLGWPPETSGVLVSGGSQANLTALACARLSLPDATSDRAILYLSSEGHSSVSRAAHILGFADEQVRFVPVDELHRIRPEGLAAAVEQDVEAGLRPFLVVGNAGSTNTGAVDPLDDLADVCTEHEIWLHVDGAYGGFAVLTERGTEALRGLDRADSATLDPHKWLYQPYEVGCLLVREGTRLGDAFHIMPDYLQDTLVAGRDVNFADRGIQLTRSARSFKLWLSLKYFGVGAFRRAIDRSLDLAIHTQEVVEATPELELVSPAMLGVVCFRRRYPDLEEGAADARNMELVGSLRDSGEGFISSTRVEGRYALRICVLNHRSGEEDVERVLGWLATA
jgi:glutamate/tyrosine decarboxylase-like PLP-dependent enzyme